MSKHVNGITCESCNNKLKMAHPDLAQWFNEVIKPKFKDAHISWAFRNEKEQNQAHAEGKSKLAWPLSMHNKSDDQGNPCALAIDLFELCSNGMARWAWGWFKEIAKHSKNNNCAVDWGHDLWGWDDDHFQLKKP